MKPSLHEKPFHMPINGICRHLKSNPLTTEMIVIEFGIVCQTLSKRRCVILTTLFTPKVVRMLNRVQKHAGFVPNGEEGRGIVFQRQFQ